MNFFKRIVSFFRREVTIDAILGDFHKIAARLDAHAKTQDVVAKDAVATVTAAKARESKASQSAARARHVRSKIVDLVG